MLFSLPFSVFHVSPESIIELSERWACHQVRKLGFMLRVWNRGPGTRTGTQYAWRRRKSYQGHYHRGHMSSSLLQHCSMDASPKDPLPVAPPLPSTTHVQIQGPHSWYEESKEWSQHVLVGCRERDIPLLWNWLLSSHTFFPPGSHSQCLQEAFIANTCQVFSINTTEDIFSNIPTLCKCLFSQCTKKVSAQFP